MVDVRNISKLQFDNLFDCLKGDKLSKYLLFNIESSYGIFYNEKLIGLLEYEMCFNQISINLALLDKFRGNGYSLLALNKFVEKYGKEFNEFKKFLCLVNPNNYSANRSLEKSDWIITIEYDETMLYEGGSFHKIYYKNNPYYVEKRLLKDDKK